MKPRRFASAVTSSIVTRRGEAAVSIGALGFALVRETPAVTAPAPFHAASNVRSIDRRRKDRKRQGEPERQRESRTGAKARAAHPDLGDDDDGRLGEAEDRRGKPLPLDQQPEQRKRRQRRDARKQQRSGNRIEGAPARTDREVLDESLPDLQKRRVHARSNEAGGAGQKDPETAVALETARELEILGDLPAHCLMTADPFVSLPRAEDILPVEDRDVALARIVHVVD